MAALNCDINLGAVVRSAMRACDRGIENDGANLALRQDPSHTRTDMVFSTHGAAGRILGVQTSTPYSHADEQLFTQIRHSHGRINCRKTLEQVLGRYDLPTGDGQVDTLSDSLRTLTSALERVAGNASPLQVQECLQALDRHCGYIRRMSAEVQDHRAELQSAIRAQVMQVNGFLGEIAVLNRSIGVNGGAGASTFADKRRKLLHDLNALINIEVHEDGEFINVYTVGGVRLVHRDTVFTVECDTDKPPSADSKGEPLTVDGLPLAELEAGHEVHAQQSGVLKALLEARDDILTARQRDLDGYAKTLADLCNGVYAEAGGEDKLLRTAADNAGAQEDVAAGLYIRIDPVLAQAAQASRDSQTVRRLMAGFIAAASWFNEAAREGGAQARDGAGYAAKGEALRTQALKLTMEPVQALKMLRAEAGTEEYRFNTLSAAAKDRCGVETETVMEHLYQLQTWRKYLLDVLYMHNSMAKELSNLFLRS